MTSGLLYNLSFRKTIAREIDRAKREIERENRERERKRERERTEKERERER